MGNSESYLLFADDVVLLASSDFDVQLALGCNFSNCLRVFLSSESKVERELWTGALVQAREGRASDLTVDLIHSNSHLMNFG